MVRYYSNLSGGLRQKQNKARFSLVLPEVLKVLKSAIIDEDFNSDNYDEILR